MPLVIAHRADQYYSSALCISRYRCHVAATCPPPSASFDAGSDRSVSLQICLQNDGEDVYDNDPKKVPIYDIAMVGCESLHAIHAGLPVRRHENDADLDR
jgi:hypothetical protein